MRSQLYLREPLRQRYINDLTLIKKMFVERIQPIFANAEKEAEEYQSELWEQEMSIWNSISRYRMINVIF